MTATKIATCCYCGTRAALVLTGDVRHELSCARCGAPLHKLKMLPIATGRATAPAPTPARQAPIERREKQVSAKIKRPEKRRKTKSFARMALSELWDIVEDVLD